jgi:hypothetical protein
MTPGKDMDYEARKKAWEERYKKFRKMVANYEREYGPKTGWAGLVQTAQRMFNAAMDNPLGAVVGLAVGLGVMVASVGTALPLLGVLAAAGAAAFTYGFAVGLADNVLFGGRGGNYVGGVLGDYGTALVSVANGAMQFLGLAADVIMVAGALLGAEIAFAKGVLRDFLSRPRYGRMRVDFGLSSLFERDYIIYELVGPGGRYIGHSVEYRYYQRIAEHLHMKTRAGRILEGDFVDNPLERVRGFKYDARVAEQKWMDYYGMENLIQGRREIRY